MVFRPSTQHLNVVVDSFSVGLVDDRYGHHIKVLTARVQVLANAPPLETVTSALSGCADAGMAHNPVNHFAFICLECHSEKE